MWRKTPQTVIVLELLNAEGHATNQRLVSLVHKTMPDISATTVHRITKRLVESGRASYAPSVGHSKIIDSNARPHDHFHCRTCGRLIDIRLPKSSFDHIQEQLPGKLSRENLMVSGVCKRCEP